MKPVSFLLFIFLSLWIQAQDQGLNPSQIPDSLKAGADAVLQLDEMQVHIAGPNRMEIRTNRIITVLNSKGNQHLQAYVGYNNSRNVTELKAVIFDGKGEELKSFRKKEFADVSAVDGGTLYSDSRVLYLPYTPVTYPYTVHFSYTVVSENTSPIPSWFFLSGYRLSALNSKYELHYALPDLKPDILEQHLEGLQLQREEGENAIRYTAKGIKAIREEPLSPPITEIVPSLRVRPRNFSYEDYFGSVDTWSDLGRWMHSNLLQDRSDLPEGTVQMARDLVAGTEDPLEKARIIYEYVQKHTRYISVQVGIGGIQPITASEVDRLKYGDCKGLSNYTKALLEAVGVEAYYVHVYAGKDKLDFIPDFADLAQGNHVILAIPQDEELHWVDCTSQTLPFGFIGDFTDDRLVHVIREDGGELVRTPSYLDSDNLQLTSANCELHSSGKLMARIKRETTGTQYDKHYPLQDFSQEELLKYYQRQWTYLTNLKIKSVSFENDKKAVHFNEELEIEAGNNIKVAGDRLLFAANVLNRFSYVPDRVRNRRLPFEFLRGFEDREDYELSLPDGFDVESLPPPTILETPFGSYSMEVSYKPEGHKLTYKRNLLLKEGSYKKEDYKDFREFCIAVARHENAQVVLVKNNSQTNR